MTGAEMFEYTQELLNKEANSSITPEEWEVLINASQLELVQNKYNEIESNQKRIDDLRNLIPDPVVISNTGSNVAGGEIFVLPFTTTPGTGQSHGYMFMLNAAFKINYVNSSCGTGISELRKAKPMRRDKLWEFKQSPYNRPAEHRLYYYITDNNTLKILTGTESYGVEALVEYLRYPIDIEIVNNTVDCELPPHMHKEICDLAGRKYLEITESQRYRTILPEQSTQFK